MDNFNLARVREMLPKELPKMPQMPSWPAAHRSMNPDDDETPAESSSSHEQATNEKGSTSMSIAEPKPISSGPKSNLDLISECDSFPYYHTDTKSYLAHINTYYAVSYTHLTLPTKRIV